jgi:DNA ligase D-like protein (predicted polymerase)/DNA ligase D-like protein (predicted 3'-phosphoesterase)
LLSSIFSARFINYGDWLGWNGSCLDMSLKEYKKKRAFNKTPEPSGRNKNRKINKIFVIHKHAASHLHYDLRLEMRGVLKSWAVPKGPSLNPQDKRLAIHVEDHPYDYKDFEGTIPKDNYGAGEVIIWDKGEYELIPPGSLAKGSFKFILYGKKLRGAFSLVKMKNTENNWLLIKLADDFASTKNISIPTLVQPMLANLRQDKSTREVQHEPPIMDEQTLTINHHRLKLTHLAKIYWPEEGMTKGEVIDYYRDIAEVILPYLKNRPQSLNRHPDGITGKSFFQKNLEHSPSWIKTKIVHSAHEKRDINYLVCQNEASLIYLAQLGCIEINPWLSRIRSLDYPDYCVLDLDPEAIGFEFVIQAAQKIHRLLEKIAVENFCKTSGATGLHIYIPLGVRYTYEQSAQFAELIATFIHNQLPEITSITRLPAKRQGKVYLDYLQNRRGQTVAAPYSLRPRPQAPISTPLQWREVNRRLNPNHFNIKTILRRIDKLGDIWLLLQHHHGISLNDALNKLHNFNSLFKS